MADEGDFIALMRALAITDAARALRDDVAVIPDGAGQSLVLTTDTLVEGVHFRADDPADSIGWKLAAVNLSDLAAKGAKPVGCLLNYALSGNAAWDESFAQGLRDALTAYTMPLLGGDTVAMPQGAPRSFSLTAIGRANHAVPGRSGVQPGDALYLTGPVGDAGLGLDLLNRGQTEPAAAIVAYRRPQPRVEAGLRYASRASAAMDVSDGLLIDASRMAEASGCAIMLTAIPLSPDYCEHVGQDDAARLRAACAGDDYELLLAFPPDRLPPSDSGLIPAGHAKEGTGLSLMLDGRSVPLPARMGWVHNARSGNSV